MASEVEHDDDVVLSLLDDEYARAILVETSRGPQSASDLAEACGASEPTIYRRLERLRDQGLVEQRQEIDPDGHHFKTYVAVVEAVTVEVDGEGYVVEVTLREPEEAAADRFTRLYEGLR